MCYFLQKKIFDFKDFLFDKKISINAFLLPNVSAVHVSEIFELLKKSSKNNLKQFTLEIFFEFYINKKKLCINERFIKNKLQELKKNKLVRIEDQQKLAKLYRDIVSDLFDPYITLLVACHQFMEGKFDGYANSNLSFGEKDKFNYCMKRMNATTLLNGYDPVIRNAMSHSGTDGVQYEDNYILFKSIRRGHPLKIKSHKYTTPALKNKIFELLNFISAVDIAMNLFGITYVTEQQIDDELNNKFVDRILDYDDRKKMKKNFYLFIKKIENTITDSLQKNNIFTNIYFYNCKKRNMPTNSVSFNEELNALLIEIPEKNINSNNDDDLVLRLNELFRYAIVAYPCYGHRFNKYVVKEISTEKREVRKIILRHDDLREYSEEKSGLIDLLSDSDIYLNGKKIIINVDFDKLQEIEETSIERVFPRKKRTPICPLTPQLTLNRKTSVKTQTYENYPHCIIFVSNLVSLALYLIGAIIISKIGLVWLVAYLLYIVWLEIKVMRKSCVNCYYYGKRCAFGKGKLAALFFKKGNPENFIKRQVGWKSMIPDALVSLIPLIVGVALLIKDFSWFILILMILLTALTTAGNGFVRGSLACKYCKQKELGCPAEQLFNKKK